LALMPYTDRDLNSAISSSFKATRLITFTANSVSMGADQAAGLSVAGEDCHCAVGCCASGHSTDYV
jgi:hypothetical protein